MRMSHTIEELRNHLFDTIELIKKGEIEPADAKAITNASQAILNSAKIEVDFIKALGGVGEGTGFIPLEPRKPDQAGLNEHKKDEEP